MPGPGWELKNLSENWSIYVPKESEVIFRHSDLVSEPNEIVFFDDSLRISFRVSEFGYEPASTDFDVIASDVTRDPTLGLCQGDGSGESRYFPILNYALKFAGYRVEFLDEGRRSIGVLVLQHEARTQFFLDFHFVGTANLSLVDSIIQTIEFRVP